MLPLTTLLCKVKFFFKTEKVCELLFDIQTGIFNRILQMLENFY